MDMTLANSGGTNFAPTNQKLIDRVKADTERLQSGKPGDVPVPVELVTTSASGLDPELSPAGAEFQMPRIVRERGNCRKSRCAVSSRIIRSGASWDFWEKQRINVLEVNLALDEAKPMAH